LRLCQTTGLDVDVSLFAQFGKKGPGCRFQAFCVDRFTDPFGHSFNGGTPACTMADHFQDNEALFGPDDVRYFTCFNEKFVLKVFG